jgi:hypothetical protein
LSCLRRHGSPELSSKRILFEGRADHSALAPSGSAVLFVGELAGEAVAATLYTRCGGVLRARLTGLDRDTDALKMNVPSAIA